MTAASTNWGSKTKTLIVDLGRERRRREAAQHVGGCPYCHGTDGYLNIGREHWFYCSQNRTRWCFGANILSSWKDEDKRIWSANAKYLQHLTPVEPSVIGKEVK